MSPEQTGAQAPPKPPDDRGERFAQLAATVIARQDRESQQQQQKRA